MDYLERWIKKLQFCSLIVYHAQTLFQTNRTFCQQYREQQKTFLCHFLTIFYHFIIKCASESAISLRNAECTSQPLTLTEEGNLTNLKNDSLHTYIHFLCQDCQNLGFLFPVKFANQRLQLLNICCLLDHRIVANQVSLCLWK